MESNILLIGRVVKFMIRDVKSIRDRGARKMFKIRSIICYRDTLTSSRLACAHVSPSEINCGGEKKDDRKTESRKRGVAALPLHMNIIDMEVKRFDMLESEHIRAYPVYKKKKCSFSFTISRLRRTPMQLIAAKLVTGYVTVITVRYRRIEQSFAK